MSISQAVWCYWGVLFSALEPITSWGSSLSNSRAEWANCLAVAIATPLLSQLMLIYFICGFCSHCEVTAQCKGVCWGLQWTRMELIWYPCTIGLTWSSVPASFQWSSDLTPSQCRIVPQVDGTGLQIPQRLLEAWTHWYSIEEEEQRQVGVNQLTFLSSQALVRKIDTSDNIYVMESTTGNLFSLTQEGAPLCRIIAKVNFRVGDQRVGLGEEGGRSACLVGGNSWFRFALATALTCCVTFEESLFSVFPRHHDFISRLTQPDIVVRVPQRNITYEMHLLKQGPLEWLAQCSLGSLAMAAFTLKRLRANSCSGLGHFWRATGFILCWKTENSCFQGQ